MFAALFPAVTHAGGDVAINSRNFPDQGFRSLVSDKYDTDGNGVLSSGEISNVKTIRIRYYDYVVRSLDGIEVFTELESLDCEENSLTSLDISNNSKLEVIWCGGNKDLSVIHLNTNIWELYCYGCNIEALYIANAPHLLDAYESGWTNIDFEGSYKYMEYGNPTKRMVIRCDPDTGIIADKTTGWKKISGKWYYFNSSGVMQKGWLKLSGKWYYFENSGVMLANTSRTIGGKTYHFNSKGECTNP